MKYPNPLVACLIETIDSIAMMEGSIICVQKYSIYLEQGPFLNIFPKVNYHLV